MKHFPFLFVRYSKYETPYGSKKRRIVSTNVHCETYTTQVRFLTILINKNINVYISQAKHHILFWHHHYHQTLFLAVAMTLIDSRKLSRSPQTVYTIDHIRILSIGMQLRSLQWEANARKYIKKYLHMKRVASIAGFFQSNTEDMNMVYCIFFGFSLAKYGNWQMAIIMDQTIEIQVFSITQNVSAFLYSLC